MPAQLYPRDSPVRIPHYTVPESGGPLRPCINGVSYRNRRSINLTAVQSAVPAGAPIGTTGPISVTTGQLDQSRYTSPSQLRLAPA